MNFDSEGYDLRFIQRQVPRANSSIRFTSVNIYKFKSEITGFQYIVRAEFYNDDLFMIKFYVQSQSASEYKYSTITNKGDLINILNTCINVIVSLSIDMPQTSFGILAAQTFDKRSKRFEPLRETQRFKIYKYYTHNI